MNIFFENVHNTRVTKNIYAVAVKRRKRGIMAKNDYNQNKQTNSTQDMNSTKDSQNSKNADKNQSSNNTKDKNTNKCDY